MRKETALAIFLATAAPMAAMAQQDSAAQPDGGIITSQKSGEVLSDSYVGADVVARAPEGFESIGKVSALLFGPDDKIVGVVVDIGGFLGVGAKPVGLSWAALTEQQSEDGLMLRTTLTREDFEAAPEFKSLEMQQREATEDTMGTGTTGTGATDTGTMGTDSPTAPPEPQ